MQHPAPPRALERILNAAPGIRVDEVVDPRVLAGMPDPIRARFAPKAIRWREDREVWGLDFDLVGDDEIEVGHFRGHHLADRREELEISELDALWVVERELEGVLLHELGHALLKAYRGFVGEARTRKLLNAFGRLIDREGLASTYGDDLEEQFAGAVVRWGTSFINGRCSRPAQTRFVQAAADEMAAWLGR